MFFKPYKSAFWAFKDGVCSLHDSFLYDNKTRSFAEYIERLLDTTQYFDSVIHEDVIFEIGRYIENVKSAAESLISLEIEIIGNNFICSKMSLLKEQRKTCNRALGALRIGNYNNAVTYIIKLKDQHLGIFPDLKDDFNAPYRDNDQGEEL